MKKFFSAIKKYMLLFWEWLRARVSTRGNINQENYTALLPLISSTNGFLQNSVGMFIPSMIALNGALLFLAIDKNYIKDPECYWGAVFFVAILITYIFSILLIILCRFILFNKLQNYSINI